MTSSYYSDELFHYGVLGMKWGRRKDKTKYVSKNREDIALYKQRGANRIQKRMKTKGMTRKQARRREFARQVIGGTAASIGTSVAFLALTNPRMFRAMNQGVAAVAGKVSGNAYRKSVGKVIDSFGGYSYKNAVKFVKMNAFNKVKGVTYSPHKHTVKATKFLGR